MSIRAHVYSDEDIGYFLDALAQTVEVMPMTMQGETYRIGYLRALRDIAKVIGIFRGEPRPRRPVQLTAEWDSEPLRRD